MRLTTSAFSLRDAQGAGQIWCSARLGESPSVIMSTASFPGLSALSSSASFQTSALPPHPGAQPRVLALPIARARRRRHRAGRAAASTMSAPSCRSWLSTQTAHIARVQSRSPLSHRPSGKFARRTLAEHYTIGEESGPAEHTANTDSAKRLEQVVDKFSIHNFCVSSRSVCHSATLQGINPLRLAVDLVDFRGTLARIVMSALDHKRTSTRGYSAEKKL
jgi:hypothetical protein